MERNTTRRTVLLASAGALAGFAGCIGTTTGGDADGPGTTDAHDDSGTHEGTGSHAEETGAEHHESGKHGHGEVGEPVEHAKVAVNTTDDGEQHFDPHVTRVTVGGRVTWVLESGSHTATAYHPRNDQPRLVPEGTEAWDSGLLTEPGETYEHTFDVEGVYHYFCVPHEAQGMLGTVIVGSPDPAEQIALQTIPEGKPKPVREKLETLNDMVRSALSDGHQEASGASHNDSGHHEESGEHNDSETHHDSENETDSHHHNETG
ncbi:MAG: plastocyanin/azurin family copper-binding protein [Halanaeroarchaeum sp.]